MWGCVKYNWTEKACSKQVRWLYYTNAKGSRMWPLDTQTLNWLKLLSTDYNTLSIAGGLYTTCGTSGSTDIYSIYWQIEFTDTSTATSLWSLSAGMMYDAPTNSVNTSVGLFPTLQYFNNQSPIWYIFDNVWGIGFVWGIFPVAWQTGVLNTIATNSGSSINTIFWFSPALDLVATIWWNSYTWTINISAWADTIWNISVLWNVLLSRWGLDIANRQSVLGNPSRSSSIIFSDVVNTSDVLNALRKNSDGLCRWAKKITSVSAFDNELGLLPKVICVYNDNGTDLFDTALGSDNAVHIDLSDPTTYDNTIFVVKWRNVVLEWSVPSKSDAINIFVDNGNVLLKNNDFNTEVVTNTNSGSTNYGIFSAKGWMINDYNDMAPILDQEATDSHISVWGWYTHTYRWDYNLRPQVWASFVYKTLSSFASGGNTGALSSVNYGVFIRWNVFVNGLLAWWQAGDLPNVITNKYYFHGRLASLNTALDASWPRKTLIDDIFGSSYGALLQNFINFSNVFDWECKLNGYATDGLQPCKVGWDVFKFNPIVLINTWVPTVLLP